MSSQKKECVSCKSLGKMCNQDCVFSQFFGTDENPDYKILDRAYGIKDVIQSVNLISDTQTRKITLMWLLDRAKKGLRCKLFSSPLVLCSNIVTDPRGVPALTVNRATGSWIIAGLCISLGDPYPCIAVGNPNESLPGILQQIPFESSSANPYFIGNPQLSLQCPPTVPRQHLQYGQQQLPFTLGVAPPAIPQYLQYGQQQLPFTLCVAPPATPQDLQYGQLQLPFILGVAPHATLQDLQYGQQQRPFTLGVAPRATLRDLLYGQKSAQTREKNKQQNEIQEPNIQQQSAQTLEQNEQQNEIQEPNIQQQSAQTQEQNEQQNEIQEPNTQQQSAQTQEQNEQQNEIQEPNTQQQSAQTQEQNEQQNEIQEQSSSGPRTPRHLRAKKSSFK